MELKGTPLELVIQALVALGTICVAILAIWGDWVRATVAAPKLEVALHDPEGEAIQSGGIPARYYHLKVRNRRRWTYAKNVRVMLTKVSRARADGTFPPGVLSGPLQLMWQYPQFHPVVSTIGRDEICDLGNIRKDQEFRLLPYVLPDNFEGILGAKGSLGVEVVAVSDNAESEPLWIEINWDGRWSDDTNMMNHLVIKAKP